MLPVARPRARATQGRLSRLRRRRREIAVPCWFTSVKLTFISVCPFGKIMPVCTLCLDVTLRATRRCPYNISESLNFPGLSSGLPEHRLLALFPDRLTWVGSPLERRERSFASCGSALQPARPCLPVTSPRSPREGRQTQGAISARQRGSLFDKAVTKEHRT